MDQYSDYLIFLHSEYDETYEATKANINDVEGINATKYKILVYSKESCLVNRDKDGRVYFEILLYNVYLEPYKLLLYNDKRLQRNL